MTFKGVLMRLQRKNKRNDVGFSNSQETGHSMETSWKGKMGRKTQWWAFEAAVEFCKGSDLFCIPYSEFYKDY